MMFTFFFPLMFLVIFSLGSSDRTADFRGGSIPFIQFFMGGIIAYGLIGATFTSLAMRTVNQREQGVLKRIKGTPLPVASFIGGQIGSSLVISVVLTAITVAAAVGLYDATLYAHTIVALVATLVVGSMSFCAIGLALASIIPNADSAPAIVNFTFLPLAFISDIFYSLSDAPSWLTNLASVFPVKHLANALQICFDPRTAGSGFSGNDLLVMAAWGVGATVFCLKRFRWESTNAAG
jgi:ABC-2 type transport system permease protein